MPTPSIIDSENPKNIIHYGGGEDIEGVPTRRALIALDNTPTEIV